MNLLTPILLAIFVGYTIHCLALLCETLLEEYSNPICQRCCRIARWISVASVGAVTVAYGWELSAHF